MRVLVTGAAGQLGSSIVQAFAEGHAVAGLTHRELDITDAAAVRSAVSAARPDVVVNCAAYNDVDAAEETAVDALSVNALAVQALARAARELGAALVHYSTDFVFNGTAAQPYVEEDTRFHELIGDAARNELLTTMLAVIWDVLRTSRESWSQTNHRAHASLDAHRRILDALARRDAEAAGAASADHIRAVGEWILKLLGGSNG